MNIKKVLSFSLLLICIAALSWAITNPKWKPAIINMSPSSPSEGDDITFSANLRIGGETVLWLPVVIRLDGIQVWSHTYPKLISKQNVPISYVYHNAAVGSHNIVMEIDPNDAVEELYDHDNLVSRQFNVQSSGGGTISTIGTIAVTIAGKPDLKMSLILNPVSPEIGQKTTVEAIVENIGNAKSVETKMRIRQGGEAANPKTWDVPALKPGRHHSIMLKFKPDRPGIIYWRADVDHEGKVVEWNERNNDSGLKTMVIKAPDLAITQIRCPDHKQILGQKCIIAGIVKNIGTAKADTFEIDADWEPCTGIAQGRHWVRVDGGLNPGAEYKFRFTHRFGCYGNKTVTVIVDKNNQIIELNETNNQDGWGFNISAGNIFD